MGEQISEGKGRKIERRGKRVCEGRVGVWGARTY